MASRIPAVRMKSRFCCFVAGGAANDVASYSIGANGAPTLLHSLVLGNNNQAITTARLGQLAVVSGGGLASISIIQVASDGTLTQVAGSPFATAAAQAATRSSTPAAISSTQPRQTRSRHSK